MKWKLVSALLLMATTVTGCSSDDTAETARKEPVLTAATLGEQTILANTEYLSQEQYATADLEEGRIQAQTCRACHTLEAGGANMIGPGLYGMFGSSAGRVDGFPYSQVLANAEFSWTPRALDAWLAQPSRFLPGNLMSFPGIREQQQRDDLIAYLLTVTATSEGQ